nr:carboxy terminal-processing peptidase [uncultured Desulfobulbus sp.]
MNVSNPHPVRRFLPFVCVSVFLLLSLTGGCLAKKAPPEVFDTDRNELIALILSQQLPAQHFSHEPLDDRLSQKVFDLYLRQLDPRKRFLLAGDVKQLGAFSTHVDDELSRGNVVLPEAGREVLNDRVRLVQGFIDPLLNHGFDYEKKETLEIEPKKLEYPKDKAALKERWRLSLKLQVLESYFSILQKEEKDGKNTERIVDPAKHADEIKEAVEKVRESMHRSLSRLLNQSRQDHYDRYFDAVTRAYDPHTDYLAPTSKEDFDIQMSGSLEGIGALLREDEGLIKVVRIIPGSAAKKQGQLQAEDSILAVAEKSGEPVDISEMRIREAVGYIRGPKGTEVRLTVQKPDGSRLIIPIIRDVVRIEETYVRSTIFKEGGNKYGYVRIPSFYRDFAAQSNGKKVRNVTDDTEKELAKLQKEQVKGIIIDLRNNGGGALTDAVQISGLFLPGGPVVQVKNSHGSIRVLEDDDPAVQYKGPLIVLVNQFSASASEILAAALQDYDRAFIIGGAHTHGKGTVQAMMDLNRNLPLFQLQRYEDLGALKLTIQKFYRINGGSTQYKGVEPNLVVPSMFDYLETGEKYMDYSLPWDQVESVDYAPWRGAHVDTNAAIRQGAAWVSGSDAFEKIQEETDKARIRAKETKLVLSWESMWNQRLEIETAREEAKAAGLVSATEKDGESMDPEEKLEQLDEIDPYVQLALYLLNGGGPMHAAGAPNQ